ncbi:MULTISPECIES: replication initiation protein RepM [Acinetobacter]|jgi:plasmid replication initiation protein|uniref:Replication initiation protein RepM n=2 Tax=Acinetobacter calcoaceticus/baumannii complex TaxID=909768 RepID=A0AB35K0Q0_9GAMM|nr:MULTISPECIES: replication initiation protein RepM [Acinetobacter]EXS21010.1 initiator Replication family protein [Acinetobacter baumannii 573719]EXR37188.1 initiator Replication family protein [Acinetobacter sp. 1294243]KRI52504.1 initiator RepB protein [Acinetobacter pittii]MBJ8473274.1 replication initiation protein [Acinetobacter pittii]MBJ8503186.1 replication initiation protein [Acinetobacter pittii]
MSNIVYKDNNLVEASYSLNLSEQRLILIAIIAAREIEKELTSDTILTIHASEYMKQFNLGRQASYEALQSACDNLFERHLNYKAIDPVTGKIGIYKSRWVSKVGYVKEEGCVQLIFAPDIIPLFVKLEEKFTRYELKQISPLTSIYAIRLYELLIRWRSTGKLYISIDELRSKLGLIEDEYKKMGDFKKRVLTVALNQINKFTDITVSYIQKKEGRNISELHFMFEEKEQDKRSTSVSLEPTYKLTAKQCIFFAKKLCDITNYPKFGNDFAHRGETLEDFQERISSDLLDSDNVRKYFSYLLEVGYAPKYKK